ncbi:MAG: flagellar hook-length control protein FliK [Gallionellaceae bacterium]
MSNLPIVSSAPQTPAKPAQSAAPADEGATQSTPFNDVLAKQVSNSSEDDSQVAKKTGARTPEEIFADIADLPAADLPTDMLATLIPRGKALAKDADTLQDASISDLSDQAALADTSQLAGLLNQTTQAGIASEAAGLPKLARGSSSIAKTGLDTKAESLLTTKGKPGAGKGITNLGHEPLIGAKKDAAFTSMLATMNSNMADKLGKTDDKISALAANPQPSATALASMQTAATSLAPSVVMPAVVNINTPVTHDRWGDEFNQKITWLAGSKDQSAQLHLNPPQLGPMDVVLKVSGDQATALFTSAHAAVREAIELALPKLREMMAESGIMLGNATVSDQSQNRHNEQDSSSSTARANFGDNADVIPENNVSMRVAPISRHNGIVDTFA